MPPLDATTHLGAGERAPDFVLPRDDERPRLYGVVGGQPTVLVFGAGATPEDVATAADRLRGLTPPPPVHVVSPHEADGAFHDARTRIHAAYGVPPDGPAVAVVLDPNTRIVTSVPLVPGDGAVTEVAAALRSATLEDVDATVSAQAPVLLLPGVLDAAWCDRLTEAWTTGETAETGVEASADGGRREQADHLRKRRRDLVVTDEDLRRELTTHVGRQVMPEVHKAFAYEATRFEGFKIGGYEAGVQGFFAAHRDNLSPSTAHRRFALTLNLNEDYDGGELRFPEYGRHRYRPPAGGALVFSGSLLHEVLPVTRGRRLVLLSFLFNQADRR